MIERRASFAVWLSLACVLAASCGGTSVSHGDDDDGEASGGNAGDSGETGGRAATGGSATGGNTTGGRATGGRATGGRANGGTGASSGGLGGAAGTAQSGSGGASGSAGEGGAAPCAGQPPAAMVCGDDLTGIWIATGCSLRVTGVVDLSGLGLSPECPNPPVTGFVRVSGAVKFDGATYSDNTITSGESTFELDPACLLISGTETTCGEIANPMRALGYASVRCVTNEETLGCACVGNVEQSGGLGFISFDASTYGTYATSGNELTLTTFGDDTQYASCVSPSADTLTLALVTVARTGKVADPIGFVKQ